LRTAAKGFGPDEAVARARCGVAEAEIALVSRDLAAPFRTLGTARAVLEARGDRTNAAHAGYIEARRLLLIGRLDESERTLRALDVDILPPASRAGYWLVAAGIAMRRIRADAARSALDRAGHAARETKIPALAVEVEGAVAAFDAPAARIVARGGERLVGLAEVERLIASDTLVIDACRNVARVGDTTVPFSGRPVLFALLRILGEAWPEDASREMLLARAFRAKDADESHRARLRVEIGRLRRALRSFSNVDATARGFALRPFQTQGATVLAPPVEGDHAAVLALLADGEAWSSSALALALGVSARTVQRALRDLGDADKVDFFGSGRARRWTASGVPGFPTSLLLPAMPASG
jgi:hypothetical protein